MIHSQGLTSLSGICNSLIDHFPIFVARTLEDLAEVKKATSYVTKNVAQSLGSQWSLTDSLADLNYLDSLGVKLFC